MNRSKYYSQLQLSLSENFGAAYKAQKWLDLAECHVCVSDM